MSSEPTPSCRAVFEAALARSPDPVVLCSAEGRYVAFSDSFCDLTGYSREQLLGRTSLELGLVDAAGPRRVAEADVSAGRGGLYRNLLHRADGATRHVEFSHQLLDGAFQLVIIHDVTGRVLAEYMIGEAATADPLTRLPGRRAFETRAARLVADAMSAVHLLLFELAPADDAAPDATPERDLLLLAHALQDAAATTAHPTALARLDGWVLAALVAGGTSHEAAALGARVIERINGAPSPGAPSRQKARFGVATQTSIRQGVDSLVALAEQALNGSEPGEGVSPRARPSSAPASRPFPRG